MPCARIYSIRLMQHRRRRRSWRTNTQTTIRGSLPLPPRSYCVRAKQIIGGLHSSVRARARHSHTNTDERAHTHAPRSACQPPTRDTAWQGPTEARSSRLRARARVHTMSPIIHGKHLIKIIKSSELRARSGLWSAARMCWRNYARERHTD